MAKEECDYCKLVNSKLKIHDEEKFFVILSPNPSFHGHTLILPKEHYNIIEQVPDRLLGDMLSMANQVSKSLFETMNIHGTNIIIQNGIAAGQDSAHFCIHIIPRIENDGLNFEWKPKQLDEEEMSTVELMLKEGSKDVGIIEQKEKKTIEIEDKTEKIEGDEENYLIKQLRRIP